MQSQTKSETKCFLVDLLSEKIRTTLWNESTNDAIVQRHGHVRFVNPIGPDTFSEKPSFAWREEPLDPARSLRFRGVSCAASFLLKER